MNYSGQAPLNSRYMPAYHLEIILTALDRYGISRDQAIELLSMQLPDETQHSTAAVSDVFDLWHRAAELSGDPLLGLKQGEHVHPSNYGMLAYLGMNCHTLNEAAQYMIRFQHVYRNALTNELYMLGNHIALRMDCSDYDAEWIRPYVEMDIASRIKITQLCTGDRHRNATYEVHFRHRPAIDPQRYKEVLGCEVIFGHHSNEILLNRDALSEEIYQPNPDIKKFMLSQLLKAEEELAAHASFASQIRSWIYSHSHESPGMNQAAQHFNTSTSTIKRKLAQEGKTWQTIYNEVMFEAARYHLQSHDKSIQDIARLLGFSQSSNFVRSFKRWSGQTPEKYRRHIE